MSKKCPMAVYHKRMKGTEGDPGLWKKAVMQCLLEHNCDRCKDHPHDENFRRIAMEGLLSWDRT